MKTYVNGTLVDTYNGAGTIGDVYPALNDLTIGGRQNTTGQRFSGLIDEVRVWNVERSAVEVQAAYNTVLTGGEAGLVGYWRFSEGSGPTSARQLGPGQRRCARQRYRGRCAGPHRQPRPRERRGLHPGRGRPRPC